MKIALIAHDKKKNEMIDFAVKYRDVLNEHELYATGTTGTLVMGETGLNITRMKSGPLGGDQQIASLSKQSLVIADLLASGILETADFAAHSNALGDKINALRSQRRTLLKQNENDDLLAELHELKDTLDDMDGEVTVYDEDLIRSVIQYATVLSDTELRIHIKGGLEVTEQLPQYYTRRCRRK